MSCIYLLKIPILPLLICKLHIHFHLFPSNLHFHMDRTQQKIWILLLWVQLQIGFAFVYFFLWSKGAGFSLVLCIISWIEEWARGPIQVACTCSETICLRLLTSASVAVEICMSKASGQIPLSSLGNRLSGGKRGHTWGSWDIWQLLDEG